MQKSQAAAWLFAGRSARKQPPDSSENVALLSWPSSLTSWGIAGLSSSLSWNGGLMMNMPLAGRPPRSDVLLLFTVSVTCSQLLPALTAMVLRRRGRSWASGRGMIGYQMA